MRGDAEDGGGAVVEAMPTANRGPGDRVCAVLGVVSRPPPAGSPHRADIWAWTPGSERSVRRGTGKLPSSVGKSSP